jgi:hypothetical protein
VFRNDTHVRVTSLNSSLAGDQTPFQSESQFARVFFEPNARPGLSDLNNSTSCNVWGPIKA